MRARRPLVLAISALWLASCAMTPRSERGKKDSSAVGSERTLGYPHEVVWSAVQAYMAVREWPLAETNRQSGLIRSGLLRLEGGRDYAHCRSGRRSATVEYEAELEIRLRWLTANGTVVSVSNRISVKSKTGKNSGCSFTGLLEDELFAGIDSVIAGRR